MLFADNVKEMVILVSDKGGWVTHNVIQQREGSFSSMNRGIYARYVGHSVRERLAAERTWREAERNVRSGRE